MAKLFLISSNLAEAPYPVFPLGLATVAGAAAARGHDVTLWDPLVEGEHLIAAAHAASACQPDLIGISIRNLDLLTLAAVSELVRALRSLFLGLHVPGSATPPIVLGGAGFSLCPRPILRITGADCGIVGEGEAAFCDLIERFDRGETPINPVIFGGAVLSGDSFGAPLREPRWTDFYLKAGGMLNVQSKRGCPHRCAYCAYPALEGRAWRARDPEAVADEIIELHESAGADFISFTDSVFNDHEGYYLRVAEELARRGGEIPWMAFFRPQRFTREEAALLKRSGLACAEWGTDCATDATLAAMGKDFTWAEVEHANAMFNEFGIANSHFIIFGGPGETEATVHEGLANIARLDRCVVLPCAGVRVLPGTRIHQLALASGQIRPSDVLLDERLWFSPEISETFLKNALSAAFGGRIDRIWPADRDQDKVKIFHQLGHRGPIWDLLLKKEKKRKK